MPWGKGGQFGRLGGAGHLSRVCRACLAEPGSRQLVSELQCEKARASQRVTDSPPSKLAPRRAAPRSPEPVGAGVHGHRDILDWAEPGPLETDERGGASC